MVKQYKTLQLLIMLEDQHVLDNMCNATCAESIIDKRLF